MKLLNKYAVTCGLLAAIGLTPLAVQAESNKVTGSGILSTTAKLNLRVTIPEFLYFRVGTDDTGAASIDTIEFAPDTTVLGDGSSISGTGGDAGGTGANVRVSSNSGEITIAATNNGGGTGLNNADSSSSISLSEITVTSDDPNLATPLLADTGVTNSTPALNGGAVTNRQAVWTYAYNNTTVPDADTYDVEITYTATTL